MKKTLLFALLMSINNVAISSESMNVSITGKISNYNTCQITNLKSQENNAITFLSQNINCKKETALLIEYKDLEDNVFGTIPLDIYKTTTKKEELKINNSSKNIVVNIKII